MSRQVVYGGPALKSCSRAFGDDLSGFLRFGRNVVEFNVLAKGGAQANMDVFVSAAFQSPARARAAA